MSSLSMQLAAMNPACWVFAYSLKYFASFITPQWSAPEAANEPSFDDCNVVSFEGLQHPHAA